jgi:hypothetical protein
MRPLILDEEAKADIQKVINFAEIHKITSEILLKTLKGEYPPVGDYGPHSCQLSFGFRVVYSLEEQSVGWCRHLSVSVDSENKLPSIPAVEAIMEEFGFTGGINDCLNVWIENDKAVNVLQQAISEGCPETN